MMRAVTRKALPALGSSNGSRSLGASTSVQLDTGEVYPSRRKSLCLRACCACEALVPSFSGIRIYPLSSMGTKKLANHSIDQAWTILVMSEDCLQKSARPGKI